LDAVIGHYDGGPVLARLTDVGFAKADKPDVTLPDLSVRWVSG
jgi:hypothetical protein